MNNIILNQDISFDFINKNKDNFDFENLSYNDNLNEHLIIKINNEIPNYAKELDWDYISESIEFSKKNVKKLKNLNKLKLISNKLNN